MYSFDVSKVQQTLQKSPRARFCELTLAADGVGHAWHFRCSTLQLGEIAAQIRMRLPAHMRFADDLAVPAPRKPVVMRRFTQQWRYSGMATTGMSLRVREGIVPEEACSLATPAAQNDADYGQ